MSRESLLVSFNGTNQSPIFFIACGCDLGQPPIGRPITAETTKAAAIPATNENVSIGCPQASSSRIVSEFTPKRTNSPSILHIQSGSPSINNADVTIYVNIRRPLKIDEG